MTVYIIIGEKQEVGQEQIGGPFITSSYDEIVEVFDSEEKAIAFIEKNKLKKPKKENFAGTECYKTGHYSLEIVQCSVK